MHSASRRRFGMKNRLRFYLTFATCTDCALPKIMPNTRHMYRQENSRLHVDRHFGPTANSALLEIGRVGMLKTAGRQKEMLSE